MKEAAGGISLCVLRSVAIALISPASSHALASSCPTKVVKLSQQQAKMKARPDEKGWTQDLSLAWWHVQPE